KLCESLHGADGCWQEELKRIREENQEQDIEFVMEDTKQLMCESRDGIARIKNIVQGLRDFSQVDRGGIAKTDINVIADNACALVANTLPENCQLDKHFGDLPEIVCNAAEIGQVIASVLINAGQAISDGGIISLRSELSGSDVVLTAEDDGEGIPSDVVDHIFEPFFTTRAVGSGTGLGLSIAYGILQKHGGSISVSSNVGQGTKVTIRLPMAQQPVPQDATAC
ncbi:MAG: sensor histidine kinase, partial [Planctomycetaceae bacterium]